MLSRLRASAMVALATLGGVLPILGCSSLTRPDDITITAEPVAAAAPAPAPRPAPNAAPAAAPRPQAAPQAPQGGG